MYYNLGAEVDSEEEEGEQQEDYEERGSRSPGHRGGGGEEPEVWNRGSVPPDLVASAKGLRVVRAEPRPIAPPPGNNNLAQVYMRVDYVENPIHKTTITVSKVI